MKFIQKKSLQTKLVLLNAAIVIAIGLGVFFQLKKVEHDQIIATEEEFLGYAEQVGFGIQSQFFERYGDVQAFALNPQLQSKSREEVEGVLNAYVALYGIYDLIIVTDLEGKIVGVNTKDPQGNELKSRKLYGRSVADAEWFKSASRGRFTEDKNKGFSGTFVEPVHIDSLVSEIYGDSRIGNGFSSIIKDAQGNAVGVVTNRAGARWYEGDLEAISKMMAERGLPSGRVQLVDQAGALFAETTFDASTRKTTVARSLDKLLKKNLAETKVEPVLKLVKEKQEGYYLSIDPESGEEMVSGLKTIDGAKWVNSLGWSVLAEDASHEAFGPVKAIMNGIYALLAVMFVAALAAAYFFARSLGRNLSTMASDLGSSSSEVNQVAATLAESSATLSSAATEQAAALQETVASVDEVSAMIAKNAENARRSQEVSNQSAQSAEKGKAAVDEVIHSINDINESNAEIMKQIEEGNRQISEIVKVITEIGNKTKVINDIVFQTKLLSFNASVEAARAGEHGKGFAVVAEEVGNLAQMSGNAAKDISQMLEASIQKVEQIVKETQSRVEKLTSVSKEKMEAGSERAQRCGIVLEELVGSVRQVNEMVTEIATASKEQAQGVAEINKAMNQLDQTTQSNATSSQEVATNAEKLRSQSRKMEMIIESLDRAVRGWSEGKEGSSQKTQLAEPKALKSKSAEQASEPSNVVKFSKHEAATKTTWKKAAGAESVPSRDDNRFEEV